MKKVSVIVPCYNSENYLNKCVDSILKQTLLDIEIILVNDGSSDNTLSIMKEYEKKFNNIIIVDLKKNKGLGNARNKGLKKATGEYISFVDSDDYIDKEMLEELYSKALEDGSDIVECDFLWEYPDKVKSDIGKNYKPGKQMLIDVRVMACNKLYKHDFLNKIKPEFAVGLRYEDILFTYQYTPYVEKVSFVRKPFYHYVQRSTSLANHQTKKVSDIYEVLNQVLIYYKKKKIYNKYKEELEYLYVRYLLGSSYKRASKIKNKEDRNEVLTIGWNILNKTFPNYKKNKYLKQKSKKNLFFLILNYPLYKFFSIILRYIG